MSEATPTLEVGYGFRSDRHNMTYKEELTRTMDWLGKQPDTIFIGQGVCYPGHGMFATLENVSMEKRIEVPVFENTQLGMSVGLALTGKTVISIFPRFDFLLCATDALVNTLDKLEEFTHGQYHAKVIIRVGIGSTSPLYPGVQHCGDYTEAVKRLLSSVRVEELRSKNCIGQIEWVYQNAYKSNRSSLIVEDINLYEK